MKILLFLQLVALLTINFQLGRLINLQDFTKEDSDVKKETKKLSEAKKRIPPNQQKG